ncbi:MAG: 23S rRNA (adenine(2503)-C(2))-methyltransferase RlmN [Alphaproteobacteria bacterium]|nr:23S rRNA (adenine(2503)-C(2))-methyltransferase RlmN [Alphaproteobacteria bacterium]
MSRRSHPLHRDAQGRLDVKSLTWTQFQAWWDAHLEPGHGRALKVYKALWQDGITAFDQVRGVAAPVLRELDALAWIAMLEPALVLRSEDGTTKFLWRLADGYTIESVLIPDGDRKRTLCVSSQVGCAMACTFCLTGDLGLKRHLKASEIANQALQVGRLLPEGERLTNLVFMGMGEPLHNLDHLTDALELCLHDEGLHFGHRKVTVSTVGLVPRMAELAARLPVNLAVSLNATTQDQRAAIMPITARHSLHELVEACRAFPLPPGKRITFEYVMFAGFNDTPDDAARLADLLRGIPAKVNLIPYNANPDRALRPPSDAVVRGFKADLHARGVSCTVRVTRGQDVSAACGQLGKAWDQAADRGWLDAARRAAGCAVASGAAAS